jgi:hypothetical protein
MTKRIVFALLSKNAYKKNMPTRGLLPARLQY